MWDKLLRLLSSPFICNLPLKYSRRLPVSAKQHYAIWDSSTHVQMNAPHNNANALKCTVLIMVRKYAI